MAKEIEIKSFDKIIVETLADITEEYEKNVNVDPKAAGMIINKCAYFASLVKGKLFGKRVPWAEDFTKELASKEE